MSRPKISNSPSRKDIELSPSGLPRRGSSLRKLKDFARPFPEMQSSRVVLPSPQLRKLRCALHSDNARSLRCAQSAERLREHPQMPNPHRTTHHHVWSPPQILIHVRQHLRTARFEKSDEEKSCDKQKDNIQHRRVVEADRGLDDLRTAMLRNQAQRGKGKLDHQCSNRHREIKAAENERSHFPA